VIPPKLPWAGGLPHSEIPGSPIARISPGLFAACHVLHRLSVPRHPPDALSLRLIPGVLSRRRRNAAAHRGKTLPGTSRAAPAQAGARKTQAASHEDTSPDRPAQLGCTGPIRLGHMTNSLFTLQTAGALRVAPQHLRWLLQTPVVEVNGFEPMTSCLQSRRSPS
jgi:hypothetical protein